MPENAERYLAHKELRCFINLNSRTYFQCSFLYSQSNWSNYKTIEL